MGTFSLLEHTADVGIVATGDTLAEALSWAAKGMFSVIAEMQHVRACERLEVSINSTDRESLVVDFLNELLYIHEAQGFLPAEIVVETVESGTSLQAECLGEKVDPGRHLALASVKAATYHSLEVRHNGEWRVQVILDV